MILDSLWVIGEFCMIGSVVAQRRHAAAGEPWDWAAAVVFTALAPLSAITGDRAGAGIAAFLAAASWLAWWLGRRGGRRRRRSPRALGHKARARLAAMARNMPRPGPVLRPVPQVAPS
jgi:hypothetical protein